MNDPVKLADGMSYERAAITAWFVKNNTNPSTGLVLEHKRLVTDSALVRAMCDWMEEYDPISQWDEASKTLLKGILLPEVLATTTAAATVREINNVPPPIPAPVASSYPTVVPPVAPVLGALVDVPYIPTAPATSKIAALVADSKNAASAEEAKGQFACDYCKKGFTKNSHLLMHLRNNHNKIVDVNKNRVEAVRWFRKAADQGHAEAQFNLGNCYYNGEGVALDRAEAVRWLRKAADQGHDEALAFLKKIPSLKE